MADDLMKPDGKSAENVSPQLREAMQEEMIRFLVQLDAKLMELENARKNELTDERHT